MTDNKLVQKLRNIVIVTLAALLGIATLAAFVLSYAHVAKWALSHGFIETLAWAFPAFVDIVTIAAELSILLMFLIGATVKQRIVPWLVVIAFFAVSVAMQVGTQPGVITTQLTLAMPPLAVAVLVSLAMIVVEALISKNKVSIKPKKETIVVKEEVKQEPKKSVKKAPASKKASNKDRIYAIFAEEGVDKYQGTSGDALLAERLGVSTRTAYRARKQYEEEMKDVRS